MISDVFNCDCMEYMATLPDKFFDLAIVDPPYFNGPGDGGYFNTYSKGAKPWTSKIYKNISEWEQPQEKFFYEIEKISKEYILWGINYFAFIPRTTGRIVWDKKNDLASFSNCEIAAITLLKKVVIFRYQWNGFLQENMNEKEIRIHPTQKPVALYLWLLKNYAKPGDKIFDSHMGSQSSRIACYKMGFDFWGCELDKEYFNAGCKRYENEIKQQRLFNILKQEGER